MVRRGERADFLARAVAGSLSDAVHRTLDLTSPGWNRRDRASGRSAWSNCQNPNGRGTYQLYDYAYNCSDLSLAGTQIQFSGGNARRINEGALRETGNRSLDFVSGYDSEYLGCNQNSRIRADAPIETSPQPDPGVLDAPPGAQNTLQE